MTIYFLNTSSLIQNIMTMPSEGKKTYKKTYKKKKKINKTQLEKKERN